MVSTGSRSADHQRGAILATFCHADPVVKSRSKALEGVSKAFDVVAGGGFTSISSGRQFRVDWQPAQERKAHAGGHILRTTSAEKVDRGSVWGGESRHILHHAED